MAKKPEINTLEELIEALRAYETKNIAIENNDWESYIKNAYEANDRTADKMTIFKDASRIGLSQNFIKSFEHIERLEARAQLTTDPVKASVMLAAAACAGEHYKEVLDISSYRSYWKQDNFDYVSSHYTISDEAINKMLAIRAKASVRVAGDVNIDINDTEANFQRLINKTFEQLDLTERTAVVSSHCDCFFSAKALKDEMGNMPAVTVAQQEYFNKVTDLAKEYLQYMLNPEHAGELPHGITMEQIQPLCEKFSQIPADQKQRLIDEELPRYRDINHLANQDLGIDVKNFALSLENGFFDNVKASHILRHSESDSLSYVEIEWARSAVDTMFKTAYRNELLDTLEKNGRDPVESVYIDGVSILNMKTSSKSNQTWGDILAERPLTLEESSRMKASVVAAAVSGKKIDVCAYKYDPDTKTAALTQDIIPIKTESKVKPGIFLSLLTWLKQFFGLEKSTKEIVNEAIDKGNQPHTDTSTRIAMSFNEFCDVTPQTTPKPAQRNTNTKSRELT